VSFRRRGPILANPWRGRGCNSHSLARQSRHWRNRRSELGIDSLPRFGTRTSPFARYSRSASAAAFAQLSDALAFPCRALLVGRTSPTDSMFLLFLIFRNQSRLDSDNSELLSLLKLGKDAAMLDIRMIERGLEKPGHKTQGRPGDGDGRPSGAVSEIPVRAAPGSRRRKSRPSSSTWELNFGADHGRGRRRRSDSSRNTKQVATGRLGEVQLPFSYSEETIAFEVAGDSCSEIRKWRRYRGLSEQRHPWGASTAKRPRSG